MTILIARDEQEWARMCADIIDETVDGKNRPVLVLTNGGTPLPAYEELVARHEAGKSYAHVTAFILDNYVGLPAGHREGCRRFMERHLFSGLDVPPQSWHVPDGAAADPEHAAAAYDALIAACGGVDLAVVGVGLNGHIASNEPGTPFETRTHVTPLTDTTRRANAKFFDSPAEVPSAAITMGPQSIMAARKMLLMARGEEKAAIVARVLRGEITPQVPGSILQTHPDLVVVLDQEAAGQL